jgi:hypothetical protein
LTPPHFQRLPLFALPADNQLRNIRPHEHEAQDSFKDRVCNSSVHAQPGTGTPVVAFYGCSLLFLHIWRELMRVLALVPMRMLALVLISMSLAGCGAVALPFRATADVARIVPVAGDVVAAPLDATGNAIDPPGS